MPPLPAIAGALRLLLHYAAPGIPNMINRLLFSGTGSTSNTALNTWTTNISNAWTTNMAPVTMPYVTLVAATAEDLTTPTAGTGAWAGSKAGTITGGLSSPADACMVIQNLTNNRSRGGHSRTYLPGIDGRNISGSDPGQWTTASMSSLLNAWNAFIAAISGANGPAGYPNIQQAVPHYYKGSTPVITGTAPYQWARNQLIRDPNGPAALPVANRIATLTIGSQRRRNSE